METAARLGRDRGRFELCDVFDSYVGNLEQPDAKLETSDEYEKILAILAELDPAD